LLYKVPCYVTGGLTFKSSRKTWPMQSGTGFLSRVEPRASCVLNASVDAVWAVVRCAKECNSLFLTPPPLPLSLLVWQNSQEILRNRNCSVYIVLTEGRSALVGH
jgi:hypothetical protein